MNVFKNKCPHCTFCANNKAVLKMHLKNFHQNKGTKSAIQEKINSDVLDPKMNHTQVQQNICEEEFSPNELDLHFAENHQETLNEIQETHQCNLCENSYLKSVELNNHLKEVLAIRKMKDKEITHVKFVKKYFKVNHIKTNISDLFMER